MISRSCAALVVLTAAATAAAQDGNPGVGGQARALIEAHRHAVLSSEIPGRIRTLTVEPGQAFEAGAVLVVFDCAGLEAVRDTMRAELHAAEVTLRQNRRLEQLRSVGAAEVELASVKVDAGKAGLRKAEVDVDRCTIKAPFAGRVVERKAQQHEFVAVGTPLLEVLSDRDLTIAVMVPSAWLVWLRAGQPFALRIDETGEQLASEVTLLGARIDAVSQSLKVTGRLTGLPAVPLIPGMSGTATFSAPVTAGSPRPPDALR